MKRRSLREATSDKVAREGLFTKTTSGQEPEG